MLFHGTASELASSVATESITERAFNSVNITSTIYLFLPRIYILILAAVHIIGSQITERVRKVKNDCRNAKLKVEGQRTSIIDLTPRKQKLQKKKTHGELKILVFSFFGKSKFSKRLSWSIILFPRLTRVMFLC